MNREEKRSGRKYTDRAIRGIIQERGWFGRQPMENFEVIRHPRWNNKPLSCQAGKHNYITKEVMNIPYYYCKKCGCGLPQGVLDQTETKQELRTRHIPKPDNRTLEEKAREYFEMRDFRARK